jgi:hypothetical protein
LETERVKEALACELARPLVRRTQRRCSEGQDDVEMKVKTHDN